MHLTNFNIEFCHLSNLPELPEEFPKDRLNMCIVKNVDCPDCETFADDFIPMIMVQTDDFGINYICVPCWKNKTGSDLSLNMHKKIKEHIAVMKMNDIIGSM